MPPATFDDTTVDIDGRPTICSASRARCRSSPAGWRSTTRTRREARTEDAGAGPGRRRRAEDDDGSSVLPPLAEGRRARRCSELKPEQKFTQPPPRYSEATLVKALEENGIGRPSTYASIISVIQAREYVNKIEGTFKPTVLGAMLVEKLLSPAFDDILDVELHARARRGSRQDRGGRRRTTSPRSTSFYKKFQKDLEARREGDAQHQGRVSSRIRRSTCDKCGKPMVIKAGKFGLFLACSGYPECENTRELETPEPGAEGEIEEACENCGKPMASSAAASASSSPAPAIPSARRRGRSSRPSRA